MPCRILPSFLAAYRAISAFPVVEKLSCRPWGKGYAYAEVISIIAARLSRMHLQRVEAFEDVLFVGSL